MEGWKMPDLADITFIDLLPSSLAGDIQVQAIAAALDGELQALIAALPGATILPNLPEVPERILDLLAADLAVDNYQQDDEIAMKQALIAGAIIAQRHKGTRAALEDHLAIYLGDTCTLLEWFEQDPPGSPYTFRLDITAELDGPAWRRLYRLIYAVKRVSAHMMMYRESTAEMTQYQGAAVSSAIISTATAV